jgi:uncharacterized protein (TIGR02646 family)
MRLIQKGKEPATLVATRAAFTTNLANDKTARTAFDQLDKAAVRSALGTEQQGLCAFCMRPINVESVDKEGRPTTRIAHLVPLAVDASKALDWHNLLASCDGRASDAKAPRSCDVAQGSSALVANPTEKLTVASLSYERRDGVAALFVRSTVPTIDEDLATLQLNEGDLPSLREQAWRAFQRWCGEQTPRDEYGRAKWRQCLPKWLARDPRRAPAMAGVIEAKVR